MTARTTVAGGILALALTALTAAPAHATAPADVAAYWKRQHHEATAARGRAAWHLNRCHRRCADERRRWRTWRDRARFTAGRLYALAWTLPPVLVAIARCESGGNPRAVSPGGTFRGKFQFDWGTWRSVGGTGDPAAASEREQDRRALILYRLRGTQPWPVCRGRT